VIDWFSHIALDNTFNYASTLYGADHFDPWQKHYDIPHVGKRTMRAEEGKISIFE
jgi:hypothetical protein